MTTIQTQTLVKDFLNSLTTRNMHNLLELFAENVDWYIPGDKSKAVWVGKRNSKKEIREFFQLLWENTEPISASIDNVFTDEHSAAIIGEFSTKMLQTNKIIHSPFSIYFTIENNLIIKYRLLEAGFEVSQALSSE